MSTMTPQDFVQLLEQHLRPRGVPFSRAALQAFVQAMFPWIADDPCPETWAVRFLATGDVMLPEETLTT